MRQKHIAFFLEPAYGHIIPTLGIALELIRRGQRVSYAVTSEFAPAIHRIGAHAVIFKPLQTRSKVLAEVLPNPSMIDDRASALNELVRERTEDSLPQLEAQYHDNKPDLVIQDECEDIAGRSLALKWDIPHIRLFPTIIPPNLERSFADGQLVLVPVPRFFQKRPEHLGRHFKFIGFIPEGR